MFRTFASLFLVAILVGCAAPPPITQSEVLTSQTPVATLVIPAPELSGGSVPSSPEYLARNVIFEGYKRSSFGPAAPIQGLEWKIKGDKFTVEKYSGTYYTNLPISKSVSASYDGTFEMAKVGSNYQLTLSLVKRDYRAVVNSFTGNAYSQGDFTTSDVATSLSKAEIPWKLEVDSEFNTDSAYANFTRLTRKEVYKEGTKDPVTGKIFKERFWVRVSGREIPVNVETYPYRNGSKVVIYVRLFGAVSGNTIDFASSADAVRKEIERIVKS